MTIVGGYVVPARTLCSGEYLISHPNAVSSSGWPYSSVQASPTVNLWKRSMSSTPTSGTAAPNSSGCCVRQAPTSNPPLDPPLIAIFDGFDHPEVCSQRATEQKSSKQFCLLARRPARHHSTPYSPPPRRFAKAKTPPRSIHTARGGAKPGTD